MSYSYSDSTTTMSRPLPNDNSEQYWDREQIVRWSLDVEPSLEGAIQVLPAPVLVGVGVTPDTLNEEMDYDTSEQEGDEQRSKEMKMEAQYEQAYYDTLEREDLEQRGKEMRLEAQYEQAYYDT